MNQTASSKTTLTLLEWYTTSIKSVEESLHGSLLDIDEAVRSEKQYIGAVWRSIGTSQERTATCCEIDLRDQDSTLLEGIPNGRVKLTAHLDNDELTIKARRIIDYTLYGLGGLLRLVDIYRLKHIFGLCHKFLGTSYRLPVYQGADSSVGGVIQVTTSIFGDAALHRSINPHPCNLHIHRVFIATTTDVESSGDKKYNGLLLDALMTTIATEIQHLRATSPELNSIFGISLSTNDSTSSDTSVPFMYLDRFLTFAELKSFVHRALFSPNARSADEAELILNCYIVNDFEDNSKNISDLPYIFPTQIHYSWALVKPSSTTDFLSTVLHGGQPPLALLFTSVFDNLSALQAYIRLFDSPQSVNSKNSVNPNNVLSLRQYYQARIVAMATKKSFDSLHELSLSVLAYGCTIGPPIFGRKIDFHVQRHLVESVARYFSSTASALRAIVAYGLALGLCSSRFIGANEDPSDPNGRWFSLACKNFARRLNAFFGVDSLHCRIFPTADSAALANLLLTTAATLLETAQQDQDIPICYTALPSIITAIAMYAQMYWCSTSNVAILSNCHVLLSTLCNLRGDKPTDTLADLPSNEKMAPQMVRQIVRKFMHYPPPKSIFCVIREPATSYLRYLMKADFHTDFADIAYEVLSTAFSSTPRGLTFSDNPGHETTNNSWLSVGARLAKLAAVRSFTTTNSSTSTGSAKPKHHKNLTLGAHQSLLPHLVHCDGCVQFASRILKVMSFLNPGAKSPPCFRPILALSGSSALRCSYNGSDPSVLLSPIFISQFWLPQSEYVDIVAAPLDSIADSMVKYLTALCLHGTAIQLLSLRFVVLNSLSATEQEDMSCFEIPPVDVSLPIAFRDPIGCSAEIHRWWSISPRHHVLLRGLVNISEPPQTSIFAKCCDDKVCFVEFFVDFRPCFTSELVTAFRPFDRLNHIFTTMEDYEHFEGCMVRLSTVNDTSVIGFGVDDIENAVSMAAFFNSPLVPFAQRQLDIDIHSRYAVAMATSNWLEAILLAHWHSILVPITNQECYCSLVDSEANFRRSMSLVPLLRLPHWLKGMSSLALYCRDSLLTALNFSISITALEVSSEFSLSKMLSSRGFSCQDKDKYIKEEGTLPLPIDVNTDFCKFEIYLLNYLLENIKIAQGLASKKTVDKEVLFTTEPTGYGSVAWAVAADLINNAIECVKPQENAEVDPKIRWQDTYDRFHAAGHHLSKLAALILGYCDTVSYYHLFAFSKNHALVRRVSHSCVGSPSDVACPPLPRAMFRQDIVALTRFPVFE